MSKLLTIDLIKKACKNNLTGSKLRNAQGFLKGLEKYGSDAGLDKPHRMAHFLAQIMHESAEFRYFKEIWGPTTAQRRYEGRSDLGNFRAGDGKRYMGRGPIQLTGRHNYNNFTIWVRKTYGTAMPNFVNSPNLVENPEYGTLAAIWYWTVGNPTGKSLNRYADDNNIEMITRRVNGGLNGYQDRIEYYDRSALTLAGYENDFEGVKAFQKDHPSSGIADGIVGSKTRMALHEALKGKNPFEKKVVPIEVEEKIKDTTNKTSACLAFAGTAASGSLSVLADLDWEVIAILAGTTVVFTTVVLLLGPQLAKRVKEIRTELEDS